MKQTLLLVITVLLIGAVAFFAFDQGAAPPPMMSPGSQQSGDGARPDHADADVEVGAQGATEAAAESVDEPLRNAVVTRDALLPLPDDIEWTEVRIVTKDGGEIVAGAEVHWFDDSVEKEVRERKLEQSGDQTIWKDPEQLGQRYGWMAISDDKGIARIHRRKGTQVTARFGDLYGHAEIGEELVAPRDGFELQVERDLGFDVRVVDAHGRPAIGIPIALGIFQDDGKFLRPQGWSAHAMSTAPDGIARIAHLQKLHAGSGPKDGQHHRVYASLPAYEDPGIRFEAESPPEEPVVLQLPPTGRLKVQLKIRGKQVAADHFSIYAHGEKARSSRFRFGGGSIMRRPDADGWARFDHLLLGNEFSVGSWADGNWLDKKAPGPMVADSEVEVTITPAANVMMLTGRLLLPDGSPAVDSKVVIKVRGDVRHDSTHETDGEGRFLFVVGKKGEKSEARSITFAITKDGESSMRGEAPGRHLNAGVEDIGDVRLAVDELILAGRCLIDGKPGELPRSSVRRLDGEHDVESWRSNVSVRRTVREDGTFELRGQPEGQRFRLTINGRDFLKFEPVDFTRGQQDLVVELTSGAELAATVLLPEVQGSQIEAELVPTERGNAPGGDEAKPRKGSVRSREGERQQVDWKGTPDGVYELRLSLKGFERPLHVVPDVVVPPPENGDPRLVDIDLRDRVRVQVVKLFDAEWKPIERARGGLFPIGQDESGELAGYPCWGKEVKLVLPTEDSSLLVGISGYRPLEIACKGEPLEVRLDPWPSVTIAVGADVKLPEGMTMRARLKRTKGSSRRWRAQWNSGYVRDLHTAPSNYTTVEDGRFTLKVGDEPRLVELQLRRKRKSTSVKIADQSVGAATPLPTLEVDAEALQKAIDELVEKTSEK